MGITYGEKAEINQKIAEAEGRLNTRINRAQEASVRERAKLRDRISTLENDVAGVDGLLMTVPDLKSRLDTQKVQIDALHARLSKLEQPRYRAEGEWPTSIRITRIDDEVQVYKTDATEEMQKDIKAYFVANRRSRKPVSEVTEEIAAWLFSLGYKKG